MESSMTGTGIELAIVLKGIKYLSICLFVWFIEPIFGFVVINSAEAIALLTPYQHAFLNDVKVIIGVLVSLLLAVKYFYDILKTKKSSDKK